MTGAGRSVPGPTWSAIADATTATTASTQPWAPLRCRRCRARQQPPRLARRGRRAAVSARRDPSAHSVEQPLGDRRPDLQLRAAGRQGGRSDRITSRSGLLIEAIGELGHLIGRPDLAGDLTDAVAASSDSFAIDGHASWIWSTWSRMLQVHSQVTPTASAITWAAPAQPVTW